MSPRLRMATFNLLHGIDPATGAIDLAATTELLRELDVDVVALQEVDREQPRSGNVDQTAHLAEALGLQGVFAPALLGDPDTSWRPVRGGDPGGPAYGVALLTRDVAPAIRHPLPGGGPGSRRRPTAANRPGWDREPRIALSVDLPAGRGSLRVTTTHLSYLPWRGLAQLRAVERAARSASASSVLAGDLNLPAAVVRAGLRHWRHAGGTATYPASAPRVQLDHILVSGAVRVVDVQTGPPGPSDHLPVVVTVELDVPRA